MQNTFLNAGIFFGKRELLENANRLLYMPPEN